jgi:four helix bundle protein
LASALAWGARGRRFESCRPDFSGIARKIEQVNSGTGEQVITTGSRRKSIEARYRRVHLRSPAQLLTFQKDVIMAFMFEKLEVYQKAVNFADNIIRHTEQFPRGYYFLIDQLNKAALSISTNIAEGNGRFTKADRRNFFTIARGSVQECVPLLEICLRRGLINKEAHSRFCEELETMAKMISGLIKGIENRDK